MKGTHKIDFIVCICVLDTAHMNQHMKHMLINRQKH